MSTAFVDCLIQGCALHWMLVQRASSFVFTQPILEDYQTGLVYRTSNNTQYCIPVYCMAPLGAVHDFFVGSSRRLRLSLRALIMITALEAIWPGDGPQVIATRGKHQGISIAG